MTTKRTRADRVREALADDIVVGRLTAGARLDEVRLAKRFAVSRTPVREALRELAATGLVASRAHQGAVVAAIPSERVTEICESVAEVEAVCARLCAIKMSAADRRRFEELHRHCGELVRSGDADRYHVANASFHAALRKGSHNSVLEEMVAALRNRFAPLSRAQFRGPGRLAQSYREHDLIVRSILRGDGDQAYHAALAHGSSISRAFAEYTAHGGSAKQRQLNSSGEPTGSRAQGQIEQRF
jgi:DNA-binding GntR family transcriptional regulator